MHAPAVQEEVCHHCGESCDQSIVKDDKYFCCYGCEAVHELISSSGLTNYFNETSLENQSISELNAQRKFKFLDNEDVQQKLFTFRSDSLSVVRFFLPGVHCSSCIYLLEHLPKLDPTIIRAEVNFIKKEVTITFKHEEKSLKNIAILLSQLGYPPSISLGDLDATKQRVSKNQIGIRIAVAGFCFGNAMLMSMPEYLDSKALLTSDFKELFGWINLVLGIPVVFYAGWDYLVKATKGILSRTSNIDIPIALGILTLFGRSVYEIVTMTGPGYIDSLAGLVFFLLIGKWFQGKTYQALSFDREYTSYFPVSVTSLENGKEVMKPLKELQKGDTIVVHNDELIPADGSIIQGIGNLDYSFVTGEAKLEQKVKGERVYAGGRQKGGQLVIQLEKTVDGSELTQLWQSDVFKKERTGLTTKIDQISKYFTLAVIAIASFTAIYWGINDSSIVWNAVTAVLIVACPCALALTLPFAYGHAIRVVGENGLFLKDANVVESLADVESIVFDKTGTLTENEGEVVFDGDNLSPRAVQFLKSAIGNSSHPLSRIIHDYLPESKKLPVEDFEEVTGKGFSCQVNGTEIKVGSASFLKIKEPRSLNQTRVHIQIGELQLVATIKAKYRRGIFEMLKVLQAKYPLLMLSGDNEGEKNRLKPYFRKLFFRLKPKDKLHLLKEQSTKQLMLGDGLNDAGALKQATVGIAVSDDIHQFSPACDAIVSSENLVKLPNFLSFAKKVIVIVYIAFGISFLYNIVGLSFAVSGHLTPLVSAILMPISSASVVGFVTLMVSLAWKRVTKKEALK